MTFSIILILKCSNSKSRGIDFYMLTLNILHNLVHTGCPSCFLKQVLKTMYYSLKLYCTNIIGIHCIAFLFKI